METDLILKLREFDTPTITNVVATYPQKPEYCLNLYDPWEDHWYTDTGCRCMFPELGRLTGYAVTAVFGMQGEDDLSFQELYQALHDAQTPSVLCVHQDFPEAYRNKNGLAGGNMATAFKALGCVGLISDGPSRDADEVRQIGFQYMLTGLTPGHGPFALKAVNVPVQICGMDVAPGDVIHMDENGAAKFPASCLQEVYDRCVLINRAEEKKQRLLATHTDPAVMEQIRRGVYQDDSTNE